MEKKKIEIRDRIKELRRVKASQLVPHKNNWRKHPNNQKSWMAGLLEEIGFAGAVIAHEVDGELRLIDGHLRKDLINNDQEIPVLVLDVDEEEADKILATYDPVGQFATADRERLEAVMNKFTTANDDVRSLLNKVADMNKVELPYPEAVNDLDDDGPISPPSNPVSQIGDLWVLGDHRLLCGDSTSLEDVQRVMDNDKAKLVATDPPYLVDYTGERPNDSGKDWSETYKEIEIKDAEGFFRSSFQNMLKVIAPHAAIYCWHAHKRTGVIQRLWEELGILDHQQIIWVKPTSVFGRVYFHFRHEPCMMGWVKGKKPPHDGKHEFNSVWEVDWDGKARVVGNEHPTMKPVELFARPMRKHTQRGDICFEPFLGSGTQIIAAERLGRHCRAIEITPAYVDVAIHRWQKATGQEAVLESNRKPFGEMHIARIGSGSENTDPEGSSK